MLTVRTGADSKVAAAEAPGMPPDSAGRGMQPLDAFVAKLTQIVANDYSVAAMQTPLDLCEHLPDLLAQQLLPVCILRLPGQGMHGSRLAVRGETSGICSLASCPAEGAACW